MVAKDPLDSSYPVIFIRKSGDIFCLQFSY